MAKKAHPNTLRSRIKEHRKVRAGDILPHELNPRTHTDEQRQALQALYDEVGFARSVLAYELPDGRLKLIDGHLRQSSLSPDTLVDVEILDVTDEEAKKLLLSMDPLAALAGYDTAKLEDLQEAVETDSDTLATFWANVHANAQAIEQEAKKAARPKKDSEPKIEERFAILIDCADEIHQRDLLRWLKGEGLKAKALIS